MGPLPIRPHSIANHSPRLPSQMPKINAVRYWGTDSIFPDHQTLGYNSCNPGSRDDLRSIPRSKPQSSAFPSPQLNTPKNDVLTGLESDEAQVNPTVFSTTIDPLQPSSSYNPIWGYGLVNANRAVARAMGDTDLDEVPDLGGVNLGNDLVNAPDAWAQGIFGQDITVAVIDSGIDIFHPDLDDNIWTNPGEIAGDGLDNDGNGYVDDLVGWDFGNNSNDVMDHHGHGTHVAGTIAAEDNDIGITGVAPDAQIMPIKIGDVDITNRFINPGNLAQAIRYAVDNGADVINMSLGWTPSYELLDAFAYAASQDVITVTASGNQGLASPSFPGAFSTVFGLTVGAVNSNQSIATFSNRAGYDRRIGYVAAPGVGIYSTRPTALDADGYGFSNGTSMAAPYVAGVVALMLSANPDLTHDDVRDMVTQSATDLSTSNPGFSPPAIAHHPNHPQGLGLSQELDSIAFGHLAQRSQSLHFSATDLE